MFNRDMNLNLQGRAAECQEMVEWFCVCRGKSSVSHKALNIELKESQTLFF